jgi:hypothetical protein
VDRPIPADAQDLREPLGIVPIVLVDPGRQSRVNRARTQADDGKAGLAQAVHQPGRERAGLQAQGHRAVGRLLLERGGDRGGIGRALAAPDPLSFLVQHADADLPLRDIDACEVRHAGFSWFQPAFAGTKRLPPIA